MNKIGIQWGRLRGGKVVAAAAVLGLASYALIAGASVTTAGADTAPVAGTPATVSADSLPTVQINGVVWSQVVVGTTVYVTGAFTSSRPAGSAAGVNETPTSNILAYNITTGNLITSFSHSLNAQGLKIAASPDGSRVYVGGDFTQVDGVARNHIAAFNTANGALDTSFKPSVNNQVRAIVATNSTVYFGGSFTYVNGLVHTRLAAVSSAGVLNNSWTASADDETVYALTMTSPSSNRLVVGGKFTSLDGQAGHVAIGAVDTTTGALATWNYQPYNAGNEQNFSYVTDLTTDGTNIFSSNDGEGGSYFDGRWSATGDTGTMIWQDTCYGASYGVFANAGALYSVGHAHNCSSINGFPQTDPWTWHRALAETTDARGTDPTNSCANCTSSNLGKPVPASLDWFPTLNTGTYTGQSQGGWTVTGNSQYVVLGGEFTKINNGGQQGLARFAVTSVAPNKVGPTISATLTPTIVSLTSGTARLSWQTAWDMDNETLTYKVFRYGTTLPVYTTTAASRFYNQPYIGYTDTGLTPGSTYKYFVQVSDPFNNSSNSGTTSITVSNAANTTTAYSTDVKNDGAIDYWKLGEAAGTTTSYDYAGFNDLSVNSGVTRGTPGAIAGGDNASTFDGQTGLAATNSPIPGPNVFSTEVWFRTTSTTGGKIVGFGDKNTGTSSNYDRHIYMDGNGRVYFGVYNNGSYTVNTGTGYNDGAWHQAVGTMSASGLVFYVDGKKVGANGGTSVGQPYNGYWRIGGDSSWAGDNYFDGDIDDVSIYPTALSLTQVRTHYVDSGRTLVGITAPADTYGATVWNDQPDVYYRLDEAGGSTAADYSGNSNTGLFSGSPTFGVAGVTGGTRSAVTFTGNGTTLASSVAVPGPSVYSEELWFKTNTTAGGKLIGFGNAQSGQSSAYDRHVYMETDGRLTFGTYTGQLNTATSTQSYNDNQWHYLVATQGPSGMNLLVDGQSVATNPQTAAQGYTGYWRIGGDTAWNNTVWFNGTIDEAAVYSTVLTPAQIAAHYNAASAVNHAPVAAFSASTSTLTATLDATGSTDADGNISSYAWNFGDNTTGTGSTTTHTYAAAGTYTITLTVTDAGGLSSTTTRTVTVSAANVPPTASFIHSESVLTTSLDATASTDTDGTIASYGWNFGDNTTGTGVTTSHTYTASGTYTVTLTVTDNSGAATTTTASVSVLAPNVLPTARATATVSNLTASLDGSTSSDSDGTITAYSWNFGDGTTGTGASPVHTYASAGPYSVTLTVTDDRNGQGSVTIPVTVQAANVAPTASFISSVNNLTASFDATASSDSDGTIAGYAWNFGDSTTGTGVTPTHAYAAAGSYTVTLTVTDNGGASNTTTGSVSVTAPPAAPVVVASDDFGRTVTNGFGSADTGGAWTPVGANTNFGVSAGSGKISMKAAGSGPAINLNSISSSDIDTQISVSTDKAGTGGGIDVSLVGRRVGTNDYNAKVRLLPGGVVRLGIYRTDTSGTQTAVSTETVVTGLTYTPGDVLTIRFQVTGTGTTTLKAKVWNATTTQPTAWMKTATDTTAALQVAGSIGVKCYLSGSSTNSPVVATWTTFRTYKASTMPQ